MPTPTTDDALQRYMRDTRRYGLMTPKQESARAHELVDLKARYWRQILSHPPLCAAIVESLDGAFDPAVDLAALRKAADAVRRRDMKSTRARYDDALGDATVALAHADPECIAADRVAADVEALAGGGGGCGLNVPRPRTGSRRFAAYLARVRGASVVLRTARNRFARANLRLVLRMAMRYRNTGTALSDLIQDGNIGLLKAVDRFDPRRGFRFSTYAGWWIRHGITRALADRGRTVRIPSHMHTTAQKLRGVRRSLRGRLGRDPNVEEMAGEAGISPDKAKRVIEAFDRRPLSLDLPLGSDDPRTVGDLLEAPDDPTAPLEEREVRDRVRDVLQQLDPVARDILTQRFGLEGAQPRTLKEIGVQYSLSRERIRQLQEKALSRIRSVLAEQDVGA